MPTPKAPVADQKTYSLDMPFLDKFMLYIYVPLVLVFSGLLTWQTYEMKDKLQILLLITMDVLFLFICLFIIKYRGYKTVLNSEGMGLNKENQTRFLMKWEEVAKVKEILGSGTLFISDLSRKKKIVIRPGVADFEEIRERIFKEWKKTRPRLLLPCVFKSFPFRTLEINKTELKLKTLFCSTRFTWKEIQDIQWGFFYFLYPASRLSFVKVTAFGDKRFRLFGWNGQLPEIFITLQKLKGERSPAQEKPIFITQEKLTKNLWLMGATGALWIMLFAFLEAKVYLFKEWIVGIGLVLIISLSFWFSVKRESIVMRKVISREVAHPIAALILMFFSLIAGFFIAMDLCNFLGTVRLAKVKKEISVSGYSMEMPVNAVHFPNNENAAFHLREAEEVPSAKSLIYRQETKSDWDKPFYKSNNQFDTLTGIYEDFQNNKWTQVDTGLALNLLVAHQDSIKLVETAFQNQKIDWGIDFNHKPSYEIEVPKVAGFLPLGRLFLCKSYLLARQGNSKASLGSLKKILFLGKVSQETKFFIGEMIDIGIYRMALSHSSDLLATMDPQLIKRELLPLLKDNNIKTEFCNSVQFQSFGLMRWAETEDWGFVYKPLKDLDNAFYYQNQLKQLKALDLPYSQEKKAVESYETDFEKNRWMIHYWQKSLNLFSMQSKAFEAIAWCRLTRASVEARIYHEKKGQWPTSVDQLPKNNTDDYVDPFADQGELQINPEGQGIRISSLGPDEDATKDHPAGRRSLDWIIKK